MLDKRDRPPLERLRKYGVVGKEECVSDNLPRFIPFNIFFVYKDAHQLRDGKCWVCVVELNGDEIRKLVDWLAEILEATHDIAQTGCRPEILLL